MGTQRRIFVVGPDEAGSRSIQRFCSANRLHGVHWDEGRLAETIDANRSLGRPLLAGYERYRVFSGMESVAFGGHRPRPGAVVPPQGWMIDAYRWFDLLDRQYPGSLFISPVRPVADWIDARLRHGDGAYAEACRAIHALGSMDADVSLDDLVARWTDEYHEHIRRLRGHFAGSGAFLEIDVTAADAGDRTASFLEGHGFEIRSRVMPHPDVRPADAGRSEPEPSPPRPAAGGEEEPERLLVTVIGRGHSGTRAMSHTLSASGVDMGERINVSGDLIPGKPMYEAARILARHVRWLGGVDWDFSALHSMPIPDDFTAAVHEYLRGTLASTAARRGWKLPETTLCYPWIRRMFPDARYVFWIRDPRDCILGGHLTDDLARWGIEYPPTEDVRLRRAYSWIYQYKLVKAVPEPKHWIEVRFEDFVLDQEATLGRLERFLGFPLARIPVRAEAVGRWRAAAGTSTIDFLEPAMRDYGYSG